MGDLEVREVSRWYGSSCAVDAVSFKVASGTVTGLLGPNGSGKTSLIRRVLDLDEGPGRALFAGSAYRELAVPFRTEASSQSSVAPSCSNRCYAASSW